MPPGVGYTFDRTGRGDRFDRGRVVGPLQGSRGRVTPPNVTRTAQPSTENQSAEDRAATARSRSLERGGEIQDAGVAAIRDFDPMDFLGADALKSIFQRATITNFLPQLKSLQARNARRGVRGPLAGALEGDLAAGFQRNLLSTTAQFGSRAAGLALGRGQSLAEVGGTERAQGLSLLGTELELELARERKDREERSNLFGTIGRGLGMAGGFLIGGPPGAAVGGEVGSGLGRSFS